MSQPAAATARDNARSDARFVLAMCLLIVAAHAIAFFSHEFAHSFLAWALGFMQDPLALDYGGLTPGNLLFQIEIGDNVQYAPILASGHGALAAAIALAGPFVGNGVLYAVLYAAVQRRLATMPPLQLAFVFWLLLMCAANVWSYVPIRAITTHSDIATAASGLGLSPLALFPFVLFPALLIVAHFFTRTCVPVIPRIAGADAGKTALLIALACAWFFVIYGGIGFGGSYGMVPQAMSLLSGLMLFPWSALWLWRRLQ